MQTVCVFVAFGFFFRIPHLLDWSDGEGAFGPVAAGGGGTSAVGYLGALLELGLGGAEELLDVAADAAFAVVACAAVGGPVVVLLVLLRRGRRGGGGVG